MSEGKKTKSVSKINKDQSVDALISQAVDKNLPVETMERLFSLREKVKAEQAKEAFVGALAGFQNDCPVIEKTKSVLNKDGTLRYKFAPIDSIVDQIKEPLSQNGLSYTWDIKHEEDKMIATAKITHILGHSETSTFAVPIDKEGYMTAPQKYASAQTFAKRYALTNALGISTSEEDTDATDVGEEKDVKSDKSKIIFLLRRLGFETNTKEGIEKVVKETTKLSLEEGNYTEIILRLETLVKEREEHDENSKV